MRLKDLTAGLSLLILAYSTCPCALAQTNQRTAVSWKHYGSYAMAANQKSNYKLASRYILQAIAQVDPKKAGTKNPALLQILGDVTSDTIVGLVRDCMLNETPWSTLDTFLASLMDATSKKYGPGTLEFAVVHTKFAGYYNHERDSKKEALVKYWDSRAKERKRAFNKSERKVLTKTALYFMNKNRKMGDQVLEIKEKRRQKKLQQLLQQKQQKN